MCCAGDDLKTQVEHDIAFHAAIARAARNPVFDQHDRIAEAIGAGDPVAAEAAMSDHFDLSLRALSNSGFN